MPSAMILTSDPQSANQLSELLGGLSYRVRSVNSLQSAVEWFSMQTFHVFLVDARYGDKACLQLLNLTWKYNPLTFAGIFNFAGDVPFRDEALLVGAMVYTSNQLLKDLQKDLLRLPSDASVAVFRILLVEDLDAARDIICSYIEALGYPDIRGVSSVDQALEVLATEEYSCVITDIHMPDKSGIALLKEIRGNADLRHLPLIILTTYSTPENLVECLQHGASGFVAKPPSKAALRTELDKAKRIIYSKQDPRLCNPADAERLQDLLSSKYAGLG